MINLLAGLDRSWFLLLNGRLTHPILDSAMPFITNQENWYPVLIGLWIALLIWGGRQGRIAALLLIIAVALADQIASSVVKPLVGRIRPCNALPPGQTRLLVDGSKAFSFPSAHAANSFAMATVLSWRLPKVAPIAFVFAALVAYSRIYVGVHYPFDVIAGALLGLVIGRLLTTFGGTLDRKWRQRAMATAGTHVREE